MKKILMIIILVLCIAVTGCDKYTTYTELTYTQLQEKLNNKDTFAVVIGSSTCTACSMYKTTMDKVIKKNQVEIFYIDITKLSSEEAPIFESKFVIGGTPTTIFIKNGVEESTYNRINGTASYTDIVNKLKKLGYIGE